MHVAEIIDRRVRRWAEILRAAELLPVMALGRFPDDKLHVITCAGVSDDELQRMLEAALEQARRNNARP